jgi:uncharacterized SAM-binding protein YcdF (DUF218 family)
LLYETIANLLIPPVGFLVLALAGVLARQAWRGIGVSMLGLGLCGLLAMSLPIVPSLLLHGLEQGMQLRLATPGDASLPGAIVVLGGTYRNGLDEGGLLAGAQPGGLSLARARAAAVLQRQTGLPLLVSGSGAGPDHPPISALMAGVLRDEFQVPVRWVETRSTDTWQNALDSAAILRGEGIDTVYVVTDGWHMRRAMIAFRHAGLRAWPAPVAMSHLPTPIIGDFLPRVDAWLESYYAMHEWIGCAYYALRG